MAKGAVLVLLLVAMYTSGAQAYTTYISNQASRSIVATTSYDLGTSQFTNRVIAAGTHRESSVPTYIATSKLRTMSVCIYHIALVALIENGVLASYV